MSSPTPQLDAATLDKVAKSARIHLTPEEKKQFLPQLQNILEAFKVIQEVNVDEIAPSFQPLPVSNTTRKDVVTPSLSVEEALQNTPHAQKPYVKGPKVM